MKREFVNLTPHKIMLNDGTVFEPSGIVARVEAKFTDVVDGFCRQQFGKIENLPDPKADTIYIVSAMVFSATDRVDVVAPATGHPETVRNEKGHIVSVPCLIRK